MAKEKTYTKHMSLKEILSYSIGLFGLQAVIFYINSYAAEFYSRTMGANIAIVGVILLVAKVVSAVFDPVVGNMIEKQTGGKYGKLKPFIFWSIPFLIVLTILCFVKLPVSGVPMYIIIFVLFTLWSMAMTLGDVPSQGIAAVLTPDITERTNMLSIANTFKSIGQAAPYVVVPVIVCQPVDIGVVAVDDGRRILMVTEKGKGKQVRFDQFKAHGRGTMGQKIYTVEDSGLVGAVSVCDEDDVVFVTLKGQTIRVHAKDISIQGRAAMGVRVASFKKRDDSVNAIAVTSYQEVEDSDEDIQTPEQAPAEDPNAENTDTEE